MKRSPTRKFSKHLRFALHQAGYLASLFGHTTIEPMHVMLGFFKTDGALAAELLSHSKLDPQILESELRSMAMGNTTDQPQVSDRLGELILGATTLAYRAGHPYVGTEHMLKAILDKPGSELETFMERTPWSAGAVKEQLEMIFKSGAKLGELTETFTDEEEEAVESVGTDELPPAAKNFGVHLTEPERAAGLDPVIGRNQEIERMMQILIRRTKNNPVLLGDPGVGKTAIVEGLAKRISQGQVPPALRNKKIVSLDLGGMVAGTMFRGEFENRIKSLIEELKVNTDIIVFIDELHTLVGAGAASGSIDAANLLKPALARGELRCIGATTVEEYRKSIENDGALERRFQPIYISEPSPEETTNILQGLKKNYETFHGLTITDEAIGAAVALSERYLPERFLPDKAIDLLDEAAARIRVITAPPPEITRLHELQDAERIAVRRKETATHKEQFEDAIHWKQEAERLGSKRSELEATIEKQTSHYPTVDTGMIMNILTSWTNVPVAQLEEAERSRLQQFENHLGAVIVGQSDVRRTVADTIRRARLGLSDSHRPLASFLFIGPTGVGKTTLAKTIAKVLFGDERALLSIDMSEYSEGHTVSKLIGSPAGYVGYKESGFLTEKIRRRPYQVILFDEFDRAHRDVHQLLMQILAEGSLRDASGRLVNFKQAIIVATMNPLKHDLGALGFDEQQLANPETARRANHERLHSAIRDILPAELVQRFDAVVPFAPLIRADLETLLEHELKGLNERMQPQGVRVTVSKPAAREFVTECLNEGSGARGLKRNLQRIIETEIATLLLQTPRPRKTSFTLKHTSTGWHLA